jgi:hypothetical protein
MKKEHIMAFCDHIRNRQEAHGVPEAFAFKRYDNRGKKVVLAEYGGRVEEQKAAERAVKQTQGRRGQKRAKNKQAKTRGTTRPTATVAEDQPLINPTLRDMGDVHPFTNAALGDPANLHPVIDPALGGANNVIDPILCPNIPSPPFGPLWPGQREINGSVMQRLLNAGHHPIEPFNGPADGPPLYRVEANTLQWVAGDTQGHIPNPENAENAEPGQGMIFPDLRIESSALQGVAGGHNPDPENAEQAQPGEGMIVPDLRMRLRSSSARTLPSQNPDPPHAEGSSSRKLRSDGVKKGQRKGGRKP